MLVLVFERIFLRREASGVLSILLLNLIQSNLLALLIAVLYTFNTDVEASQAESSPNLFAK